MSATIPPVIVIPGITASDLFDQYELPPEAVWTTMRHKRHDRITLHPADQRYELLEPARVKPGGPFPLVYGELVEELRDGLSEGRAGPVPVFPFGYDWRMPLDLTEARLDAFVREVIDRTLLMPLYRADPDFAANPTVTLIGHSMGGLIIAGYLERYSAGLVDKVVTLATPFQGSWEAVLKLTTGTGDLGEDSGKARERHAARMTPALYHLLPSYGGGLTVDKGLEPDIFHPATWQPSVVRTIEGKVAGWDVSGAELFAEMLGAARVHRDRVGGLRLEGGGNGDAADGHDSACDSPSTTGWPSAPRAPTTRPGSACGSGAAMTAHPASTSAPPNAGTSGTPMRTRYASTPATAPSPSKARSRRSWTNHGSFASPPPTSGLLGAQGPHAHQVHPSACTACFPP